MISKNNLKNQDVITPEYDSNGRLVRKIRSFVLREGRLTKGQELAIEQFWSLYGITYKESRIDFKNLFKNDNEVILEIGFGMGSSLVQMALENPNKNFIGIEVHKPGVGSCIKQIEENNVKNLKVICHDAVEVLNSMIDDKSIDKFQIFFPDPWHKAKHHKRRIIQQAFVQLLLRKLKEGGTIHLATDWENYSEHMLEVLSSFKILRNLSQTNDFIERPNERPLTKFENRGIKLGHKVFDIKFQKSYKEL